MKILDVDLLQDGLQRNIAMLERLQNEVGNIQNTVKELVAMEEVLKGAGGSAIRGFYSDVHLPFLHFFLVFSDSYKQKLQQIESALLSLEPDTAGYILEQFLEGELEQGLTLIANITERLTNEANSIMDTVSDIVALPHLNDSEVQEGVQNSKKKRDDTLLQLHEFDSSQTTSLHTVEEDIQTMGNWLTDMEGMFTAGVKDITFQPSQWNAITFGSEIRTELFPKVYLDPNKLWVEERDKIIGTMITAKTFQALELKRMITIDENVGENIQYHQYANGLLIKEYSENGTVYYEIVSKVEYKEEAVQVEPPKENKLVDGIQFGLDLAGLIPGIGEIADGLNGVIYYARGDKLNAGLSFAAMIPVAGWGSTATKFANKGSQLYQARNVLSDEKVASMFTPTYQEVVNGPLSRTQANMYMFKTDFNNMTPKSVTFNSPLTGNLSLSKPDVPTPSKSLEGNGNTEIKNVDVTTMGIDNINHPIRTYRNADLKKLEEKYTADPRITVEMPYVGKGKAGTNSEGWLRDKDFYWKEIMNKQPESLSKANKQKIQLGFSPIIDKTFREHFPQYDLKELYNDKLIHHHVGGGGQAVAVPSKLHPGTGGIHNAEKAASVWGNDSEYAELLEKFLNK
ncbi:T7SS effector LXG polymorphic toxin [Psychrobacillus sp. MER TA 171]|nr:T7SS effector LXG polymorphic toxin [Psychrobacillus sp. MER TA 171]